MKRAFVTRLPGKRFRGEFLVTRGQPDPRHPARSHLQTAADCRKGTVVRIPCPPPIASTVRPFIEYTNEPPQAIIILWGGNDVAEAGGAIHRFARPIQNAYSSVRPKTYTGPAMARKEPNVRKSRDEIAAAYSSPPWWYDLRGLFILTFSYNTTITAQIRHFARNFGPMHIEVACGSGTLLDVLLRWRKWKKLPEVQIVGVDYAESMLAGAINRFATNPLIELRLADAAELPYPDATFDTANVANAIHCLPDVNGALRDIFRVLKPGATLAANVLLYPHGIQPFKWIAERINRWGVRKGILYTPYQREDIRQRILNTGFEIISESVSGNCYDVLARKPAAQQA
jgi:ubiquinone/menaquinone biosynthesis C-methylase UbiE